jgi:hypothetical protein
LPQPQAPPQHPPPLGAEDPPLEALVPFAGAANTDSWMVCFELSHFGHEIFALLLMTSFSYRSPQSSQTYSKIGIGPILPETAIAIAACVYFTMSALLYFWAFVSR